MPEENKRGSSTSGENTQTDVSRRKILQGLTVSAVGFGGLSKSDALQNGVAAAQTGEAIIEPTLIEADEEAGFNFPYYFYAPGEVREKPMVVETVNSGGCDDDFQVDLDRGRRTVQGGPARQISDKLNVPMIVPVFANPCEGEFYQRFVQTLDTQTMRIDEGKFKRIDLQIIAMIEDARSRLADKGYDLPEKVMLNGFSASGNFMNNFTALHPGRVASVTAGAINGMAILPRESVNGQTTNYMIGIADLDDLIGDEFDMETWREVPQFCYMGETETPPGDDTLPYRDVWSERQATIAREIYGEDMQTDRMTFSEWEYHKADANVRFEVYDDTDHTYTQAIIDDVVEFHRRNNDIPASATGGEEAGEASFVSTPEAGDTSVEVSYSYPSDADEGSAILSVVPDGDADYWERRIRLERVNAGVEGSDTFELDTSKTGVPFEAGDTVKLWLIPTGNQTPRRATVAKEVTIGETTDSGSSGGSSTMLSASSCDEELSDPDVSMSYAEQPTGGTNEITVEYDIGSGFGQRARLRLFPETGGGTWGYGLDFIEAGQSGEQTYTLETDLPLGETAELRVFPADWSYLEDVVATHCAVVSGVKYPDPPTVNSSDVEVEYLYPESADGEGKLELTLGSETVDTVEGISPGSYETYTFSVEGGVPGETDVVAELRLTESSEPIDSAEYETRQSGAGSVSFAHPPADGSESLALEYDLSSGVNPGRFAALRLYHNNSSSWGIYLGDVDPGESGQESFNIRPDEPGVPFKGGTEVEVALVEGDDPYRTAPFSTATTTVGAEGAGQPEAQPLSLEVTKPTDRATVPATEDLTVVAEVTNENPSATEATLTTSLGESSVERTVSLEGGEQTEVETTMSSDILEAGEEFTLSVSGDQLASDVERVVVVNDSSDTTGRGDETTESDGETSEGDDTSSEGGSNTSGGDDTSESEAESSGSGGNSDSSESADDVPDFGAVEAVSGLGGLIYVILNRLQELVFK